MKWIPWGLLALVAAAAVGYVLADAGGRRQPIVEEFEEVAPSGDPPETSSALPAASGVPLPLPAPVAVGAELRERVAHLERRVESLEDVVRTLTDGVASRGLLEPGALILRDVETTAAVLELDGVQRAELERLLAQANEELELLFRTPDDTGLTWNEVADRRVWTKAMGDAPSVIIRDHAAVHRFRSAPVPGGAESYATARKRLTQAWLPAFRELLRPGQQRLFDHARAEGLVSASPGTRAADAVPASTGTDDSERPGARPSRPDPPR